MDTDVLIVGAGPTGLMLANQLTRRGVRTLIIDRHAGPARETRALGVQARTLEIYAQLGIAERAIELGKIGTGANIWSRGRRTGRIVLGTAGAAVTPYPFILILGQDDNERIMGERLRDFGVGVRWNTELVGLQQHAEHVEVVCKDEHGAIRNASARWIAGCDGAHSAVRDLCGIPFLGAAYEHVFYVADVEAIGTMVPDEVNVYLWPDGFHLFFPMRGPDHWRVVGILPGDLRAKSEVTFDSVVPSIRHEAGASLDFKSCSWFSTYRIHHRRAAQFRDRRCFLLGDAAHVHSPVGAQGMNTGLQDAYNLAWKLALVTTGQAATVLLDSYEAERMPVAKRLLSTTDRAFRVVVSDRWVAGLFRTRILARVAGLAMRQESIQRLAFRTVSQTGIHYRGSELSQALAVPPADAPQSGDRFPWLKLRMAPGAPVEDLYRKMSDLRFHLLIFGQEPAEAAELGDLVERHVIPEDADNEAELHRAGIPPVSFYLVRPDGHVGLCGERLDTTGVRHYLTDRLRMATP